MTVQLTISESKCMQYGSYGGMSELYIRGYIVLSFDTFKEYLIGVLALDFCNVLSEILQFVQPLAAQIHKWLFNATIYCV